MYIDAVCIKRFSTIQFRIKNFSPSGFVSSCVYYIHKAVIPSSITTTYKNDDSRNVHEWNSLLTNIATIFDSVAFKKVISNYFSFAI